MTPTSVLAGSSIGYPASSRFILRRFAYSKASGNGAPRAACRPDPSVLNGRKRHPVQLMSKVPNSSLRCGTIEPGPIP